MPRRDLMMLMVLATSMAAASCGGGDQGDECSDTEECKKGLICQPIKGRSQDYCCPTPPESSLEDNCHAVTK